MSKNSIALAFAGFGVLSHPDDWHFSDYLDAHFPAMVQKIKDSNCEEVADRVIAELQDLIAVSSAPEAQQLIAWLQGLRVLRDEGDLRSLIERPGVDRGFV